jgi:hypothetical protein
VDRHKEINIRTSLFVWINGALSRRQYRNMNSQFYPYGQMKEENKCKNDKIHISPFLSEQGDCFVGPTVNKSNLAYYLLSS